MRMLDAIGRRYKLFWQGCNEGLTVLSMWSESMSGSCMLFATTRSIVKSVKVPVVEVAKQN